MASNEYQNIFPYVTKTSLTLWILLNHAILQDGSTKHNNSIYSLSYSLEKKNEPTRYFCHFFSVYVMGYRSHYPSSLGADRQMLAKTIY